MMVSNGMAKSVPLQIVALHCMLTVLELVGLEKAFLGNISGTSQYYPAV